MARLAMNRTRSHVRAARSHRTLWIILGAVAVIVLAARFALSPVATWIANRKLGEMEGFDARVESVQIALWSGSVVVNDLVLRDTNFLDDPPLLEVPKATFTGALRPLLQGKLGGRAVVENPTSTVVKRRVFEGPTEAIEEAKQEVQERQQEARHWRDALRDVMPMEMSRIEVKDATMRFIDLVHEPRVDVAMHDVNVVVTGLRNRPDPQGQPMKVELTGTTTGDGRLRILVEADPMAEPLEFFTTFELQDMSLPPFNNFMRAYTDTDVSRGALDLYMEATAEGGSYQGYVKPFFSDLDFTTINDDEKSFLARAKEKTVEVVTSLLENEKSQKVATQTPFSGKFGENNVGLWETVENLWRNAFVRALREGLAGETPSGG